MKYTYTIIVTNEDNEILMVDVSAYSWGMAVIKFASEIHEHGWRITDVLDIRVVPNFKESNRRDFLVQEAVVQLLES